jgi:excisionase family DNA binding protein
MTIEEARGLPTVISVEQAGELLSLRRSAAYEAVRRGELPVLRFGRRLVVPTGKLLAMLGIDPGNADGGPAEAAAVSSDHPHVQRGTESPDGP